MTMTQRELVFQTISTHSPLTVREIMEKAILPHPGQVRRILKELRENGLIEVASESIGGQRRWRSVLQLDPVATPEDSYGGSVLDDQPLFPLV